MRNISRLVSLLKFSHLNPMGMKFNIYWAYKRELLFSVHLLFTGRRQTIQFCFCFGYFILFFFSLGNRSVRRSHLAIGMYIPSGGICVLLEPLVGEILNCCPLAAGGPKMYEKWHFLRQSMTFAIFPGSMETKLKILKQ